MLIQLEVHNIILIQNASLDFQEGFHIVSGETGAGKSALLQSLSLVLGSKFDASMIRKGEKEASVKAQFKLNADSAALKILSQEGIKVSSTLTLQRTLLQAGKSKTTINDQPIPLHLLKKIAPHLAEIVSQHGTQKLVDLNTHRELLDQFGSYPEVVESVKTFYHAFRVLEQELKLLEARERDKESFEKRATIEIEEIDLAQIQSATEEEELFSEFEKLSQIQELIESTALVSSHLLEEDPSVTSNLKSYLSVLSKYAQLDRKLNEIVESFRNATEELTEVSYSLIHYRDQLEENPERFQFLDERLKLLNHLKKRYGPTLQEVLNYREALFQQLSATHNISSDKKALIEKIEKTKLQYLDAAKSLSKLRQKARDQLQIETQKIFQDLALSQAEFEIDLTPVDPDENGLESIEFFLKANVGEKRASLREHASGGELSRVLLGLKILLSRIDDTPTLIFDEIDSNLGGETAPKIGALLKQVSVSKQVISITHLPQVAIYGEHHYFIYKKEEQKRTFSLIQKLTEKQKVKEIERMLGGENLSEKAKELALDLLKHRPK